MMNMLRGALKNNALLGTVDVTNTSTHTDTVAASSYGFTTVNFGSGETGRKLIFVIATNGMNALPSNVKANGNATYKLWEKTNGANSLSAWCIELATGETNQSVTYDYTTQPAATRLYVFRLSGAGYLAPTGGGVVTVNNIGISTHVPAGSGIIGVTVGTGALVNPTTTWTNITKTADSSFTGLVSTSAAAINVANEEASRTVTANSTSFPGDVVTLVLCFQRIGAKPFIFPNVQYSANGANATSYTMAGVLLGPPDDSRVVIILLHGNVINTRKFNTIYAKGDVDVYLNRVVRSASISQSAHVAIFTISTAVQIDRAYPLQNYGVLDFVVGCTGQVYDCSAVILTAYGLSSSAAYDYVQGAAAAMSISGSLDIPETGLLVGIGASVDNADGAMTLTNLTEKLEDYKYYANWDYGYDERMTTEAARRVTVASNGNGPSASNALNKGTVFAAASFV